MCFLLKLFWKLFWQAPFHGIEINDRSSVGFGCFCYISFGLQLVPVRVTLIVGHPPRLTSFWIISSQILHFSQPSWQAGIIKITLVPVDFSWFSLIGWGQLVLDSFHKVWLKRSLPWRNWNKYRQYWCISQYFFTSLDIASLWNFCNWRSYRSVHVLLDVRCEMWNPETKFFETVIENFFSSCTYLFGKWYQHS